MEKNTSSSSSKPTKKETATWLFDDIHKDRRKILSYIYAWLFAVRCIVWMHVFYVYASSQSTWNKSKWWTFVEATTDPISFLPYTSENDSQKVFQHLLFEACVTPRIDWTNITYENTLCNVTTQNYETFSVTVPPNNFWSDEEPITIEDVYFTYQTILKENFWNIDGLNVFKNISIKVKWSELLVTFPSASIDNMIFFTNFILPQHILANQDFSRYTDVYGKNVVSWTCWTIEWWENDSSSAIFDLTNCDDFFLKFYQVKYFWSSDQLQTYLQESEQKIDLISEKVDVSSYTTHHYIANKFLGLFYNTQNPRISLRIRELLTRLIHTEIQDSDNLIKDPFLFSTGETFWESEASVLKKLLDDATSSIVPVKEENNQGETDLSETDEDNEWTTIDKEEENENSWLSTQSLADLNQELPKRLLFSNDNWSQSYILTTIWTNWYPTKISYEKEYDKVSVTHNSWVEFYPQSYNSSKKIHNYNFNPVFRNIQEGENTYTIKGYDDEWELLDTFQLNVTLTDEPLQEILSATWQNRNDTNSNGEENTDESNQDNNGRDSEWNEIINSEDSQVGSWSEEKTISWWERWEKETFPLQFHYFENETNISIVKELKYLFETYEIAPYFEFIGYTDSDTLEGNIVSQDFDLLLRTINMWLRKDISNIFISDNLLVNPSGYTNENLASLTNRHFISSDEEKKEIVDAIDEIYSTTYPFTFIWKKSEQYSLSSSLQDSPFPKRMYVYWRRKEYVKNIKTFNHVSIDRTEVFSRENLSAFIEKNF